MGRHPGEPVTEARVASMGTLESWVRSIGTTRFGAVAFGLLLAAGLAAAYLAWIASFGSFESLVDAQVPLGLSHSARTDFVVMILISFLVVTVRYERCRWLEEVHILHRLTDLSDAELAEVIRPGLVFPRLQSRVVVGMGALFGVWVVVSSVPESSFFLRVADRSWSVAANMVLFGLMARALYRSVLDRSVTEQLSRSIVHIDLLDPSGLLPFARMGLRRAFYWAGGSMIASLLALELHRIGPLLGILTGTLLIATFMLVDPARLIHRRLREKKRLELTRVRERITRARDASLRDDPESTAEALRLPGLVAYEARIKAVSEWPFDIPTLLRFSALLLLAAGSWLGGAVVERLLGTVLD